MQAEGLSNLNVMAMLQDREGFIWAGTQNGVFRYDGFRFEEVKLAPGAATNTVSALYADPAGRIWVGLESAIEVFQEGKFQFISYQGKDLPTHAGSTFSSSKDGKVFAVSQGDLFELKQRAGSLDWSVRKMALGDLVPGGSRVKVNSAVAQEDGSLLLGCGLGICRFDGSRLKAWGTKQGLAKGSWDV
jgi:ligand-binding sensor domain-containing protein